MSDAAYPFGINVARRMGNQMRPYLLVNPIQAKHVPARPGEAWEMMSSLVRLVNVPGDGTVVIAFAETATAIGAVLASQIGGNCFFIHSTRAEVPDGMASVSFDEHHSHAVEHHLFGARLFDALGTANHVILVDDELTTGNTLRNAMDSLTRSCGVDERVTYHAASIVNRMDEKVIESFEARGVRFHYLCGAVDIDVEASIRDVEERGASPVCGNGDCAFEMVDCRGIVPDSRMGVGANDYFEACEQLAHTIENRVRAEVPAESRIAVLGTEECMFPSLMVGKRLELLGDGHEVLCHSTTRSPICISARVGYPITNGFELRSVYNARRRTFLYNLRHYDLTLVVSDARPESYSEGASDLCRAMAAYGCRRLLWVLI